MRPALAVAAIFLLASPALAQQMNAEEFYRRAQALKAKGPLALLHKGEIDTLMNEGQNAGKAARARRLAAQNAGKPLPYCPPEGKTGMGSDEFMKGLAAIPQAERQKMDMTAAMLRMLAAKYPCPR